LWTLDPRVNRLLQDATAIGFLLWVLGVVLREVFRPRTMEGTPLRGAVRLPAHPMVLRVHDLIEVLRPDPYRTDGLPFSERSDAMLLASFQASSTWRS
jgi:hypothetical protein